MRDETGLYWPNPVGFGCAAGEIEVHPITAPLLTRTLYLAHAPRPKSIRRKVELLRLLDKHLDLLAERIGQHAQIIGRCI
jgi:LysR family transcriptional regulator, nitrogen assimilation regulatory protein